MVVIKPVLSVPMIGNYLSGWTDCKYRHETVQFPLKAQCCGGAQIMPEEKMVEKLIQKLLDNAIKHGAQAMVTTLCPLCFTTLDAFQRGVSSETGKKFNMPIIALSQLMGVAFGLAPKSLGLDKNVTPVINY
jgi:heterodisulfide reductase subunit B